MKLETLQTALNGLKASSFARLETNTPVSGVSAKFKAIDIRKTTIANIQLFGTINDFAVYQRKIEKSTGIDDFKVSDTYFSHTDIFSLVKHKQKDKYYLYALYNSVSSSSYFVDGVETEKQQIVQFLTNSAKEKFFSTETYNKTNDIVHNVIVRTIDIDNIVSLKFGKNDLT